MSRLTTKSQADSLGADLMNVDYEDVLHLYRGWRKSESALKEKNKELAQLRNRITILQDSHIKFRGQIQSLQSVKELTIGLQRQISVLQEENSSLRTENRELSELNTQAETLLRERMEVENSQNKALRNIQLDFDTLRGKYEEMSDSQRELETLAADEQAMRMAAEARLVASEDQNDKLRIEIKSLKIKLDTMSLKSLVHELVPEQLQHNSRG
jgi:chromosome segregation ATPase